MAQVLEGFLFIYIAMLNDLNIKLKDIPELCFKADRTKT